MPTPISPWNPLQFFQDNYALILGAMILLLLFYRYFHDKPLEISTFISMLSVFLSLIITLRKEIKNAAKLISNDAIDFVFVPEINAWTPLAFYPTTPPLINRSVMHFGGRPGSAFSPLIFFDCQCKKKTITINLHGRQSKLRR